MRAVLNKLVAFTKSRAYLFIGYAILAIAAVDGIYAYGKTGAVGFNAGLALGMAFGYVQLFLSRRSA